MSTVDFSVLLKHHDSRDFGLICLGKNAKSIRFRKKRTLTLGTQRMVTQECSIHAILSCRRDLGHLDPRQNQLVPEVNVFCIFYVNFFPMNNLLNLVFFLFLVACFKNNVHPQDWFLAPQLSFLQM